MSTEAYATINKQGQKKSRISFEKSLHVSDEWLFIDTFCVKIRRFETNGRDIKYLR